MTAHAAAAFARLQEGLPSLAPTTEVILRPEGDRPVAILRPVGAPPRAFVLHGDDVVEMAPRADTRLPAARLLGDPIELCRALEPWLGRSSSPQLIAWRPGRRAVVRLSCGTAAVFVKFLDEKTWARAAATFQGLADAAPPLCFARPSALIPEFCAYAAAAAPGRPLRDVIAAGAAVPWDLVAAVLASLRAVPAVPGTPRHDFDSARKAAGAMLRKAAPLRPGLAALADAVDAIAPPTRAAHGFVHGDLHDKQIFVAGSAAHLIDLEGVGSGDPTFDLANLAEHLQLRALQQDAGGDGGSAALLERAGLRGDDERRWRCVVRARLAGVYALRPRWDTLSGRLADETSALLSRQG